MVFQMKCFIAKHRDIHEKMQIVIRKNCTRKSESLKFFFSEIKNALHTSTMNICVWVIVINNVVGSNL